MSQPKRPISAQGIKQQTMFYVEGNPTALITQGRKEQSMDFATAEAALVWCRDNLVTLVYFPVNLAHN